MVPRTDHRNYKVQMQIQENKDFPQILFGSNQEDEMKSISLSPGYEYTIKLNPYGQMSTEDFKSMSLDKRQCRLDHEVFENSTHPIYTYANCRYDCIVQSAFKTCKCIPWDFIHNNKNATDECDIFGRTCFFNKVEELTHGEDDTICSHCIGECDWIRFRRVVDIKSEPLFFKNSGRRGSYDCNKYMCLNPHKWL